MRARWIIAVIAAVIFMVAVIVIAAVLSQSVAAI